MATHLAVEGMATGMDVLAFAPTFDATRELWENIRRADQGVVKFRESRNEAYIPGRGRVRFRSLDNDNARGKTGDLVLIDEAAKATEQAYQEVVRPMVMDTLGDVWSFTTPRGFDWYFDAQDEAQNRADSFAVQIPTVGCTVDIDGHLQRRPHPFENPDIAWSEIESLAATMSPGRFRQEILAEFVSSEGRVFGDFVRGVHVADLAYEPNLPVYLGVDFGYRTFAAVGFQIDKQGVVRVLWDAEWHDLTTEQALDRLCRLEWTRLVEMVGVDPAGDAKNVQTGIADVTLVQAAFARARVLWSTEIEHRDPEWRASRIRDLLWSANGSVRLYIDRHCQHTVTMFERSAYADKHHVRSQPVKDGKVDHMRDALGYGLVPALWITPARNIPNFVALG